MTAVGRLLRTLRSANAMSVEEAGVGAGITPARMRRLERGTTDLLFLEGIRLAKVLDLCPNCFRRHFEDAVERDLRAAEENVETHDGDLVAIG